MKKIKVWTAIILSICMIWALVSIHFSTMASPVSAQPTEISKQNKIPANLYSSADMKDNKYLVSIFLEAIPDETINSTLLQKHGYDSTIYESEAIHEMASSSQTLGSKAFVQSVDSNQTSPNISLQATMENYISAKRSVVKDSYTQYTSNYVDQYIDNSEDIVFCSQYAPYIMAYLSKGEIEAIAKTSQVTHIFPEKMEVVQPTQDIIMPQVNTDATNGTKSSSYNNGEGYTGEGIKIGIIEAQNGVCDVTNNQLTAAYNEQRLILFNTVVDGTVVPTTTTSHATLVTALIVGSSVTANGKTYCGVVPEATVYATGISLTSHFFGAVEQLLAYNVSVINMSLGITSTTEYTSFDQYIDSLYQSQATFVVAAGNNGTNAVPSVSSPGKAYNAITVGNAATKTSATTASSQPYDLRPTSSYSEATYLTNKPDIVAPGTMVQLANGYSNSGTSFSAPIITGIVAQLHQANVTLKTNPTLTKAVLLAGAVPDVITTTNNNLCDLVNYVRDKSGVGMVDAVNSIEIACNSNYRSAAFNLKFNSSLDAYLWTTSVTIPANTKIRMVLTYNKPENILISSVGYENNLDLFFCDSDGNPLDYSFSYYNNVEVIEYTVTETGTYQLTGMFYSTIPTDTALFLTVSLAWNLIPVT